jgi:hypothetical protein
MEKRIVGGLEVIGGPRRDIGSGKQVDALCLVKIVISGRARFG